MAALVLPNQGMASKILGTILLRGVYEITSAVFQASDLAGAKRREFLGAAREGGALLRDTDGFALTMVPRSTAQALSDPLRRAVLTAPGDDDYAEVDRPQE